MYKFSDMQFFPYFLRNAYELAGNWPAAGIDVDSATFTEYTAAPPPGMMLGCDASGDPCWVALPQQTTDEQISLALTAAVQAHLDAQARALNYDDIKTAVTYADEPAVPRFQAEGLVFREWRSLCWAHCYAAMAAVHLGERAIPTAEELIAELPPLVLPT